ncbi:MAG: peptide deformylase [Candidatus Omnitrophica bacterium]|nr:peptide deformylase [Candidatus Omnitrophota bacterium]MBU4488873.1 peptide deformylase [Candidatus Omnitrophota bacterium]MCG2705671.1 peptide deformylase [Candidatus Omnitrophota bacterium]
MEILRYPNPILKRPSAALLVVGNEERGILENMAETMYSSHGVGLAAPQIGINKQLMVVDIGDKGLLRLINPSVLKADGKEEMEEGCLSVPGIYINVKRPKKIKIKALNENGREVSFEAAGLLARAIMHEIDHLRGKLIIDHINPIKRLRILKKNGYGK